MLKRQVTVLIQSALEQLQIKDTLEIKVDIPRQKEHGDYSCNIAIVAAKKAGQNSRELATKRTETLKSVDTTKVFSKIEIAGPGFINFFLSDKYLQTALFEVEKQGQGFGHWTLDSGQKIL